MPDLPEFDCTQLVGRLRSICDGTSGLPDFGKGNTREAYIRMWLNQPPPAPPDLSCVHRGEHIDWIDCPTCQNKIVRLKVFACAVHSKCTMTDKATKYQGCVGCEDIKSPDARIAAERTPDDN